VSSQLARCAGVVGRVGWRLSGDVAVLTRCTTRRISSSERSRPDWFKLGPASLSGLPWMSSYGGNCNPSCWIWTRWDNSSVTWTFRNRIELQPHARLQYDGPEWIIYDPGSGEQVKLVGRRLPGNIPVTQVLQEGIEHTAAKSLEGAINDAQRLILTGTGYNSEAEALSEGELWRGRLMRAFAALNIAADFGDETRLIGGFTEHGLAAIGRGRRVLNDPLKLWAYEETSENPLFVVTNPVSEFWVSSPHERLEAALTDAIANGGLSQERQVSYGLYAASFGLAPEPRFAMLMIAFESLIKLKPRSADVQTHVRSIITATQNSRLPVNEVQSICGSLRWLLDQSINQAGRELAKSLGSRDYLNGEAPDKFFTRCYEMRSALVHGHHPIPSPTALGQLAAPLEQMVSELIAQADRVYDGST
jgi:hypothetical protein